MGFRPTSNSRKPISNYFKFPPETPPIRIETPQKIGLAPFSDLGTNNETNEYRCFRASSAKSKPPSMTNENGLSLATSPSSELKVSQTFYSQNVGIIIQIGHTTRNVIVIGKKIKNWKLK
jgi:hypothetical protein